MAMMQKHFSRTELRALWSRMATQRNKEYITIRQPWTELTSIPSEVANQSKGSCHQVKNDGKPGYCDVWTRFDSSIAKNLDAELLTWRQLLIQHGEREALQLLRIGEVKKVQVAWSQISRYVCISGKETLYLDRGSTIETERPCINLLLLLFFFKTKQHEKPPKTPKRPDRVLTESCRQDSVRTLNPDGVLTES